MDTINDEKFKRIFRNELKINPYTTSIKTLLSDRNLRRINFAPYYQRNYVWDVAKQSFFIESVLLGTEIPPMIMFKHGSKMEVIDGRQRFETLKLFNEHSGYSEYLLRQNAHTGRSTPAEPYCRSSEPRWMNE